MPLTVLLGGARSGKSALAVRLAASQTAPVTFVATGEAGDDEMAARITRHRQERPSEWTTLEVTLDLEAALGGVNPGACVVVDCLTLWVSNLWPGPADEIAARSSSAAALASSRPGNTIVVSNEVGAGVVPFDPAVRAWRDLMGRVNTTWAAAADRTALVVAGRVLRLDDPDTMLADTMRADVSRPGGV